MINYVYDFQHKKEYWIHWADSTVNDEKLNDMKEYVDNHKEHILVINTTSPSPNPPYVNIQVYNSYKYICYGKVATATMQSILEYTNREEIYFPRTIKSLREEWNDHNNGYRVYSFLGDEGNIESGKHVDFDTDPNTLEKYKN